MKIKPHVIGIGLGWATGGVVGAIYGGLLGAAIDYFRDSRLFANEFVSRAGINGVSLVILFANVLKADFNYNIVEFRYIKQILEKYYGADLSDEGIKFLKELLKKSPDIKKACLQIKENIPYEDRKNMMYYLFGIAGADGDLGQQEFKVIRFIAFHVGINEADYNTIKSMYDREYWKKNVNPAPSLSKTERAYKMLEINSNATPDEIKKAYRRLVKLYHPDKHAYLGKEKKLDTEEKFEEVQDAYEYLKRAKGFN